MKRFVSGFVAGAIVFTSFGVFAASVQKIDVVTPVLKFIVDGTDKTPQDNSFLIDGKKVPAVYVHQGITYIPAEVAGQLTGKPIMVDLQNEKLVVGQESPFYLSDIKPFGVTQAVYVLNNDPNTTTSKSSKGEINEILLTKQMKVAGEQYSKGIAIGGTGGVAKVNTVHYNLAKQYSGLECLIGLDDNYNKTKIKASFVGDGKVLWSGILEKNQTAVNVKVDLSGIDKLELKTEPLESGYSVVDIVAPVLIK